MPTDKHQLQIRLGHRIRIRQAFPGNDTIPFVEREGILAYMDEAKRLAYFTIGVVTLPISWDNIDMIEGGVGTPMDTSGSQGSGLGTDSS